MKYTIIDKNNYFVRSEAESAFTILVKELGVQFYINQTGKYVLDLLEKYTDTEEVINELCKTFPDIDIKVLKSDFDDIFDLMVLYELIKIVEKDGEPVYTKTPYIRFAGDGDYRKLARFIKNEKKQNKISFHALNNTKDLNAISLRYSSFHGITHFCVSYDDNFEILACMIISPPTACGSVVGIEGFLFSDRLKENDIFELSNKMFKVINRRFNDKLTKFRFSVYSDFKVNKVLDFIKRLGFEKEAELQYESKNKSLIMYSKFLLKNTIQ